MLFYQFLASDIIDLKSDSSLSFFVSKIFLLGFPGGSAVRNLPAMQRRQETRIWSPGREDPLEEAIQPTPVLLLGESHGQRSLVGYSPQCPKESDMTEHAGT